MRKAGDSPQDAEWWRGATIYHVYVRSFADADGDGTGDLDGVRERLGYLELLGVDALWLTHDFDTVPGAHDATFGRLVAEADAADVKILIDLTANGLDAEDLEQTLRYWLARGVAGFRIDDGGVPALHQVVRRVLDEYPGTVAAGEIWLTDDDRQHADGDGLHLGVNFRLALAGYDAVELRTAIDTSLDAAAVAGVPPTWTLSHHEVVRAATRYGDGALGSQRARAMALVGLGLPGTTYLYNGEELGLPNVPVPDWALPDWVFEDPTGQDRACAGCRVPLPWQGNEPPFGFSATTSWLPVPPEWAKLTVERQLEDADSTLSLYRQAIELRRTHHAVSGAELEWYGAPAGCFAYRRKGGGLVCVLNASGTAVPLPAGEVLLSSGPLADDHLPPNTAAWLV